MFQTFNDTAFRCSKIITQAYSTSFSLGILTLHHSLRNSIYSIYAYVRYADEIVDTFHDFDKAKLLLEFRNETYKALYEKMSLNPILYAFQKTVHQYQIDIELVKAFLNSMEIDLHSKKFDNVLYESYIYGSAETVGLMCLKVFCENNNALFEQLKAPAQKLGSAFQKVNFLRDMKSDYEERGRIYFPGIEFTTFHNENKRMIEANIQTDFDAAYQGILALPPKARKGVYLAYKYYLVLFNKIKRSNTEIVQKERIRVSDSKKMGILLKTYLQSSFNML